MSDNELTIEQIQQIATLLKRETGIEMRFIASDIQREGICIAMVHPNDFKKLSKLFEDFNQQNP